MTRIKKIISGGQSGVDMAALRVAQNLSIETGGWAPPDMQNESGKIPGHYKLNPTPELFSPNASQLPRSLRTEWNVRDSYGTLIILPHKEVFDPGTDFLLQTAKILRKPLFFLYLDSDISISEFHKWVSEKLIDILNVAGPSESSLKNIEEKAIEVLRTLLTNKKSSKS